MSAQFIIAITTVFAAVALAVGSVMWLLLTRFAPERKRLEALAIGVPTSVVVTDTRTLQDDPDPLISRLAGYLPKSPKDMGRLQKRLARAGLHGLRPAVIYSLAELLLPVLFALAVLLFLGFGVRGFVIAGITAVVVYMLPGIALQHLITTRQKDIRNGLPDAVDLLIVCVEAGSSLDQAVVKASEELGITYPALAEELRYVNTEIRAGKPRLEAFKNFAQRTKVDDVRNLVGMMVQTDRFGTSIAQALRTFADAARTKRRQEAEERAGKLGVKLLFPLVFCLFPAMFVVLLGPAMIRIYHVLIQSH
jgi:tight adherence protein C